MALIGAIFGEPDFSDLTLSIGDGEVRYGAFITALTSFLIIAGTLFLVVRAANRIAPKRASTRDCPHCLTSIPLAASACPACTRDVEAQPA
jgi:large conductance mechanosensitive channel